MSYIHDGINDAGSFVTQEGTTRLVVRWPGKTKTHYWMLILFFAGYLVFPLLIQGPPWSSREFWEDLLLWDVVIGLFPWLLFLISLSSIIPVELRLNLASRTYECERGWPPHTKISQGTFADFKQVAAIKSYSKAAGALYFYVMLVPRRHYVRFALGQFLLRGAAEELARDCADRLGVPLVLKTAPLPETWLDKKLW
jgi:hypothetical protein